LGDADGYVGDGFAGVADELDGGAHESDFDGVWFWPLNGACFESGWEGGDDFGGYGGEVAEGFWDDWVVWPGVVALAVVEGDGDDEGRAWDEGCC